MKKLLSEIKACKVCDQFLECGANPIMKAGPKSKILIIGQAPGRIVHDTGIPWNDKSGENLRHWLGVNDHVFYDIAQIAIMPMGFCFPGTGKTGDLPPRKECAPLWHEKVFKAMKNIQLVILIGNYAQQYYLKDQIKDSLTETVQNFRNYLPRYFVLPHPSPRNNIWQAKNKWFATEVLPELRKQIAHILN